MAFEPADRVEALIDGPASFRERERLIRDAETSLHVMTWAFYDDVTGWEAARSLVERAKAGVDVRVMVDGQISNQKSHDPPVRWMEEQAASAKAAGTPIPLAVVRWREAWRPFDGLHRKLMVADGRAAIVGGMNFGDVYSHRNPNEPRRWRDTDLLVEGPAAAQAEDRFVSAWNGQVGSRELEVRRVTQPARSATSEAPDGTPSVAVAFVEQSPGDSIPAAGLPERDRVLFSLVKAIDGATKTIDIENAYVIRTAPLDEALRGAIARGVRVRVLSNSPESLDEPTLSYGIVETLRGLAAAGAEVYAKQGDTLHSKFAVIDGSFAQVGSYNLHPRSHRLELEIAANVLGGSAPKALAEAFERDIAAARRVKGPDDLALPTDPLARLAWLWFSDLL
jgi:cardiolipin synthase A/B